MLREGLAVSQPPIAYPIPEEDQPLLRLDPETVEDDDALGEIVDQFVQANYPARVRAWEVNFHLACLRDALDPESWKLVLNIEALMNARFADLIVEVARWSFEQGQTFPVPKSEVSP